MDFTLYMAYNAYKKNKKDYSYEISIPERRKVNKKKIDNLFERYMNGENLKEKEMIYLFQTIISNAEYDLEMEQKADKIYTKILNLDRKYSFAESVFFIQYSTFIWVKKQKYDSNRNIKEKYKDLKMPSLFFSGGSLFSEGNADAYQNADNIVFRGINNHPVEQYLKHIYHELTHYKQWYELNNSFVTQSAMNFFKGSILGIENSEYYRNYDFKEMEVEAEIEAYTNAVAVLKKYAIDKFRTIQQLLQKKENVMRMQAMSFQSDEGMKVYETYIYNIQEISKYIKENKEIIKKYKFLSLFYNENGNLKSEEELLESYKKSKQNSEVDITIFYEFFSYIYEDGVSNIELSDDLFKEKCDIIYHLFNDGVTKNKNMGYLILNGDKGYSEKYGKFAFFKSKYFFYDKSFEKLKKYLKFLKDNGNFEIDDKVSEMRDIFYKVRNLMEASDIYEKCTTIEEYEEIKKKSEEGDEISILIVQWVTNAVETIKKGGIMSRNLLVQALYRKEMDSDKKDDTGTMPEEFVVPQPIPTINSRRKK